MLLIETLLVSGFVPIQLWRPLAEGCTIQDAQRTAGTTVVNTVQHGGQKGKTEVQQSEEFQNDSLW